MSKKVVARVLEECDKQGYTYYLNGENHWEIQLAGQTQTTLACSPRTMTGVLRAIGALEKTGFVWNGERARGSGGRGGRARMRRIPGAFGRDRQAAPIGLQDDTPPPPPKPKQMPRPLTNPTISNEVLAELVTKFANGLSVTAGPVFSENPQSQPEEAMKNPTPPTPPQTHVFDFDALPEHRIPDAGHKIVLVTPQVAQAWLATNHANRNLRVKRVEALARDMAKGDWVYNGETGKFGETGLIDGQHRLHAIVESGVAVPMLIAWGLEDRAQATVDLGALRRMSDQLRKDGEKHTIELAALLNRGVMYERGYYMKHGLRSPTSAEMVDWFVQHPEAREAVAFSVRHRPSIWMTGADLAFAYWLLTAIDYKRGEEFLSRISDGAGLEVRDPRMLVRNRIRMDVHDYGRASAVPSGQLLGLLFKAWNAWVSDDWPSKLQTPKGGFTNDNFPEPLDPAALNESE